MKNTHTHTNTHCYINNPHYFSEKWFSGTYNKQSEREIELTRDLQTGECV